MLGIDFSQPLQRKSGSGGSCAAGAPGPSGRLLRCVRPGRSFDWLVGQNALWSETKHATAYSCESPLREKRSCHSRTATVRWAQVGGQARKARPPDGPYRSSPPGRTRPHCRTLDTPRLRPELGLSCQSSSGFVCDGFGSQAARRADMPQSFRKSRPTETLAECKNGFDEPPLPTRQPSFIGRGLRA